MITIEMIDEFRRRTNSSYDDARYYLERYQGNLLDAIIAYERAKNRQKGHNSENMRRSGCRQGSRSDFGQSIKRLLQRLLDIRIVIADKTGRTYPVPILFPLVLVPFWHVFILIALGMMLMGYRFSIQEMQDENYNLDNIISRVREKAQARSK